MLLRCSKFYIMWKMHKNPIYVVTRDMILYLYSCLLSYNVVNPMFYTYDNNWLVVSVPLKNMKVSWDYDIPNTWKNKIPVPNH
jgi:hypothetical protein